MQLQTLRRLSIVLLALLFLTAGVLHFLNPDPFVKIVPAGLPSPLMLVWISGIAEILGGAGLLVPKARRFAGLALIVLLVLVFPANINMAVNHIYIGSMNNDFILWARLPLQLILIAWLDWATRESRETAKHDE